MALRYFNPIEPEYVPTYTPLDPQITSLTNQSIQRQETAGLTGMRDELDLVSDNITKQFSNLSDKDMGYAREQVQKSRGNLNKMIQEKGARNLLPFVDEEVSRIEDSLSLHRKAATLQSSIKTAMDETEAGPGLTSYVNRKPVELEYDDQGDPVSIKGGPQAWELETLEKWKGYDDFLQTFTNEWKADSKSQDYRANGYIVSESLKEVGADEVVQASMSALLNDSQFKAQLQLEGEKQLNEVIPKDANGNYLDDDLNVEVLQNEAGKVTGLKTKLVSYEINEETGEPKLDENGDPIIAREENITFNSLAEWQAWKKSKPYGKKQEFKEVGFKLKNDPTASRRSGENSERNPYITMSVGTNTPETSYEEEWKKQINENSVAQGKQMTEQKGRLSHVVSLGAPKGTLLPIEVKNGEVIITQEFTREDGGKATRKITEEDIAPEFRAQFRDKVQSVKNQDQQMRKDAEKLKSARKAAKQGVGILYGETADGLEIQDDGTITFKSSITDDKKISIIKDLDPTVIKEYDPYIVSRVAAEGSKRKVSQRTLRPQQFNDLEIGEIVTTTISQKPIDAQSAEGSEYEENKQFEALVFKDTDGKIKYASTSDMGSDGIFRNINKDAERLLNKATHKLFNQGRKEHTLAWLNHDAPSGSIDSQIISMFDDRPITSLPGKFHLANNPEETITPEGTHTFDPIGTFYKDGESVTMGTYYEAGKEDSDDGEIHTVYYRGSLPESITNAVDSEGRMLANFDAQFRNIVPSFVHSDTKTVTIDDGHQRDMGLVDAKGNAHFDNLQIKKDVRMVNVGDGFDNSDVYILSFKNSQGKEVKYASDTISDLQNYLINYDPEVIE